MVHVCGICNREFKNDGAFTTHIARSHKSITPEQYHQQFIDYEVPPCPICGKARLFSSRLLNGYQKTCGSNTCKYKLRKAGFHDKYGVDNPMQVESIKSGMKERYLLRTGYETPLHNPAVHKKGKDRLLEEEGIINVGQRESVKQKIRDTLKEHYGLDVNCANQVPELRQKQLDTTMERYGVASFLLKPEVRELGFQAQERKYGARHFLQSKSFNDQRPVFLKKQFATNTLRYGGITPSSDPQVIDKQHATKRKNGTFKTSSTEEVAFEWISAKWKAVRQYKDDRYPFYCDFYLLDFDVFIEFHGMWTHGPEAWNPDDPKHVVIANTWQEADSEFYRNAVQNWTVTDPRKRLIAKKAGLNFIELWGLKDLERFLSEDLSYAYLEHEQRSELRSILSRIPNYEDGPHWNKIILSHQLHFHESEKKLWNDDPGIRSRLITNRVQYLHKPARSITDRELLRGFSISGLHRGFSHHSPMWIKKFTNDYDVKLIYDPFGGWGHRMLGCGDIPYIYNDRDRRSCSGAEQIIKEFQLSNKTVYNRDARSFTPDENYDTVFTCPPYYNIEVYQNAPIEQSYDMFWQEVIQAVSKPSLRRFAFIVTDQYSDLLTNICLAKGWVVDLQVTVGNNQKSHFAKSSKRREILTVMRVF